MSPTQRSWTRWNDDRIRPCNNRRGYTIVRREKVAPRAYETARNRHCGVETRSWDIIINNSSLMIFSQWNRGQCQWYAFLAVLYILDPSIDYAKIDKELQEVWDLAYPGKAGAWFQEKGYISSYEAIEPIQMKALLNRNIPLITGSRFWDFLSIKDPDYLLSFNKDNKMFQHKYIIVSEDNGILKCQNSWWEQWGQSGYFYVDLKDRVFLDAMWRIIPVIKDQHNTILKKYIGNRVDYDNAYNYQCVDWIKEYSSLRSRPIKSFWNAYELWNKWLGNNWQKIVKTTFNAPSEWDIVIWDTSWGGWYWHIAVCWKFCNPLVLRTVDQNAWSWNGDWLWKNSITPFFRSYKWVKGWYRYIV